MAENLLPGTKAIMKGTVEVGSYRKGYLVRYKNIEGGVMQRQFKTVDEAMRIFWAYADRLGSEARAQVLEIGY